MKCSATLSVTDSTFTGNQAIGGTGGGDGGDGAIDIGVAPGPLFCSMNRAKPGEGRLTATGLYGMVRELGRRLDLKVWPHGLRHAAITEALDLTGSNVRAVQRFSRHRDFRVLERYDDNRRDLAGEVAKQVAASVPGAPRYTE